MKTKNNNMVLSFAGPYQTDIIIAVDLGPYDGTRPGLDVRRLDIKCTGRAVWSPTALAIAASRSGYGCGWVSTSKLWPISEAESATIIAEIEAAEAAEAAEKKTPVEWSEIGICPPCSRCGTYCYGDCCS